MNVLPEKMRQARTRLSDRFIHGVGLEIGALHSPLPVNAGVRVHYVDRLPLEGLRRHYPELKDHLLSVDVVDDGEVLDTVPDASQDFIIANHMLEHCENPLGTIRAHLRKLRRHGLLYYAIPDKRCSFDINRPLTEVDHLLRDDREGPEWSRWEHYLEFARLVVGKPVDEENHAVARQLMKDQYSIHFHVWTYESFREFLATAETHLQAQWAIQSYELNETEAIAVIQKTGG